MLFRLRPRPTWPLPGGKSPSAAICRQMLFRTRCRLLLFRLRVRHDLTLPGGNASYTALCRLLLVRMPSRPTLQPVIESFQYNIWGRRWYNLYFVYLGLYLHTVPTYGTVYLHTVIL